MSRDTSMEPSPNPRLHRTDVTHCSELEESDEEAAD
jgi:hypothetical protein